MDPEQTGTTPESQAVRGLSPDEQRAERERESRESDESKYEQLAEQTEAETEELAQRIGRPLEPRDGE